MKKVIISIFLLLVNTLNCVSCNNLYYLENDYINEKVDSSFSYEYKEDIPMIKQSNLIDISGLFWDNQYIYFKDSKSIVRYNYSTGSKTYLHSDPLCSHASDECPFYGYDDFCKAAFIYNNKVYYYVNYYFAVYNDKAFSHEVNIKNFMSYDFNTSEIKTVREDASLAIGEYLIYNDYYYYYEYYTNEYGKQISYLNRQNINTKHIDEKIMISEFEGGSPYNLLVGSDGKIYMASYVSGTIFYCDEDNFTEKHEIFKSGSGKAVEQIAYNEDTFYFILTNVSNNTSSICSIKINGLDYKEILSIDFLLSNVFYTENYIYYCLDSKYKEIGILDETNETIKIKNTDIYRVDLNGSNNNLIFEFKDNLETFYLNEFIVIGNYAYSYYTSWGVKKDKYIATDGINSFDSHIIIRIDLSKGDIYYITGIS